MDKMSGLAYKISEMSGRIQDLREIQKLSPEEMAQRTGVSIEEYLDCEAGKSDLNFAFLYRCAQALDVDIVELIEGAAPKLSSYTLTRRGEGQRIEQAHGMVYYNLAANFRNRIAEPLLVNAVYQPDAQYKDIELTTHAGQECDIIISGKLKIQIGEHIVTLSEGDSIYYDSSTPHGMIAIEASGCQFYAMVLNPSGEPIPELAAAHSQAFREKTTIIPKKAQKEEHYIYENFAETIEDDKGALLSVSFPQADSFNFAFDIVDGLAATKPEKLALLHVSQDGTERRFTFDEMSRNSSRVANYFKSLGIQKGDRVMLVMKRNYQFWFCVLALHKLGAIAIPATDQLLAHDFEYRFEAAGVSAIICTGESSVADEVEQAMKSYDGINILIMASGKREKWLSFDNDYQLFSDSFPREEDAPCGDDLMLMFFTSGTTGYPKIAAHNYKYPLGHFVTAKYWHCADPDGIHFTISDSGWAKFM